MSILREIAGHALHVVKSPIKGFRMLTTGDSAAFYTLLGDDLVFFHGDQFQDSEKPLWLNFGYWKEARNYPDAAVALARLLADWADLRETDDVLDVVGVGTAVALMFGLDWLIFHTKFGRAMRAVSFDVRNAALMGIPVNRVISITFVTGAMLAAAGGFIWALKYANIKQTADTSWTLLGLKAFVK